MRGFSIKVLGLVLSFLAGGLAVLRYLTDWVGRSTAPEDLDALLQKAGQAMAWLSEQPSVIFYWVPAGLMLTALLLAFQPEIVGLITTRVSKESRVRDVGKRCLRLANDMKIYGEGEGIIHTKRQDSTWAKYLPIATEIEGMGLKTPPGAFDTGAEIDQKQRYLEFVGNLLLHNQLKTAKSTAKNLSVNPNQLAGPIGSQ